MLVLLFPGQGSQRAGMGAPWTASPAWEIVSRIEEVTGRDVAALLVDAAPEELRATRNAQLATFALSLVALEAARGHGLLKGRQPVAVAGHSLGEYTALVAAGALSLEEGARLVVERGEAMQHASDLAPGTMAAVLGLSPEEVAEACRGVEGAWVANDNAPGQVVVSGTPGGVAAAAEAAKARGAKRVVPLAVGGAFHSPLMEPARERLQEALAKTTLRRPASPVVTNVDAKPHEDGFTHLLESGLVAPVRWRESLLCLADMGASTFLELGPGTELSGMVKRTVEGAARTNVSEPGDLERAAAVLAGRA